MLLHSGAPSKADARRAVASLGCSRHKRQSTHTCCWRQHAVARRRGEQSHACSSVPLQDQATSRSRRMAGSSFRWHTSSYVCRSCLWPHAIARRSDEHSRARSSVPPSNEAASQARAIATDGAAARGDGQPCSKHTALAVAAAAAAAASKRAMRESAAATDAYGGRGTRCDRRRWRRRTWRRQSMQQARRLG